MNTYLNMVIELSNDSKYTKWYYNIITTALSSPNLDGEKHHILPKCFSLGGERTKANIVVLTYREHYVVHRLLAKMFEGKQKSQMLYAMWALSNTHKEKRAISSRRYDISKRALLEARKGFKHTEESKRKMSQTRKGMFLGAKNPMYGRVGELHHGYGLPSPFAGRKHTEESKKKASVVRWGNPCAREKHRLVMQKRWSEDAGREHGAVMEKYWSGDTARQKHRLVMQKRWSEDARHEHSTAMMGGNNYNAKIWSITNLLTNKTEIVIDLKQYCVEKSWNYNSMMARRTINKPYKKHKIVPVIETQ